MKRKKKREIARSPSVNWFRDLIVFCCDVNACEIEMMRLGREEGVRDILLLEKKGVM